ncbi:hypothetical protein H0O00_00415, partial [Candidatus Micrarchaeota archaeon]|nr:hypothetical protein [Candidatus Micrarchaeota archaeon]
MKRLLLVLALAGLLFALTPEATSVKEALNDLQSTTQAFLGVTIMLSVVAAVVLGLVTAAIYFLKVKGKENPGIWKIVVMVAAVFLVFAVIGAVVG